MSSIEKKYDLYKVPKKASSLLLGLLRGKTIYITALIKQSDKKAKMLLSLAISYLLLVSVVLIRFVSYIHFSYWLLLLPFMGFLVTIILLLLSIKPGFKTFNKIINKEIAPNYIYRKFYTLAFGSDMLLAEKEAEVSEVVQHQDLQIGNMIRAQFLSIKYANIKIKLLDWAFIAFLSTILLLAFMFCFNILTSKGVFHRHDERKSNVKYDFETPSKTFILDSELTEISGLSYDNNTKSIFTHNDEKGSIYQLSTKSGEIINEMKFGKKDDYEAIEKVGNNIYISTNAGKLFRYDMLSNQVATIKTPFSKKNDIEGLCLNANGDKLLFACKSKPLYKIEGDKGIFSFNIATQTVDLTPYLSIITSDLINHARDVFKNKNVIRDLEKRLKSFAPSAISVHPITNDIFIISARASTIVVYNRSKVLVDVIALDNTLIPQPEGLCFDESGNLYISSEGQRNAGKLIMYTYNPN